MGWLNMTPSMADTIKLYDFEYEGVHYKKVSESTVEISPVSVTDTPDGVIYEPTNANGANPVLDNVSDIDGQWYEVVGIGAHAFEGTENVVQFKTNRFSEKLQYIGDCAFRNCTNLIIADIPNTVAIVGTDAFNGCTGLEYLGLGVTGNTDTYGKSMEIKERAFCNTQNLSAIFIGSINYTLPESDAFATDNYSARHKTFYLPDSDFSNAQYSFSRYDCAKYGTFKHCIAVYNGQIPEFKPDFVSNLPQNITTHLGWIEQPFTANAGSGTSGGFVTFILLYPFDMSFDVRVSYTYTIKRATLNLNVKNCSRSYGEDNPEFEIEVEGYLNGDGEEIFSTPPKIVNGIAEWAPELPTPESPVGEYELVAMADLKELRNYDISGRHGILTITKAGQSIIWNQEIPDMEVGNMVELTATTTSGIPVIYYSSDPDVADINGNILIAKAEGTVSISAENENSENYLDAEPVVKYVNISRPSSIREITDCTGFTVKVENGNIVLTGLADNINAMVLSCDGRCVYSGKDRVISMSPGIYIVVVGQQAIKVVI